MFGGTKLPFPQRALKRKARNNGGDEIFARVFQDTQKEEDFPVLLATEEAEKEFVKASLTASLKIEIQLFKARVEEVGEQNCLLQNSNGLINKLNNIRN